MSSRRRHAAKGSAAQSFVAARGVPESLESFLGGLSVPQQDDQNTAHDGAVMEVNLKLLLKSNDTTKLKALTELNRQVVTIAEKALVPFMPSIVEVVIRYVHHPNELVRSGVFSLLRAAMQRGRVVDIAQTSDLPSLLIVWVTGMHDMVSKVCAEAREAFHCAFPPENRPNVLQKYALDISRGLLATVTETIEQCRSKPLQDDLLDPRSNILYASVTGLGYMVRQASAVHPSIISFVEQQGLQPMMPARMKEGGGAAGGNVKGLIAIKAPVVRSAGLTLLRDIVAVCPLTPKIHYCVANALSGAVLDTHLMIVRRVWELLLLWCREGAAEAIGCFAPKFLDDVIDSFMRPIDITLAHVIFPSLLPLLTCISRDARYTSVLDEFCGALVEKLKLLGDTPNVTAAELRTVLAALMESWELLCVRKRAESAEQHDDSELFTVCLCNLAILTESPARRARFSRDIAETVSHSLLRVAQRCEPLFMECVAILCGRPEARFRALPDDASPSLRKSFAVLQASLLAAAMARAEAKAQDVLCSEAVALLDANVRSSSWEAAAALLKAKGSGSSGSSGNEESCKLWTPPPESRARVVDALCAALRPAGGTCAAQTNAKVPATQEEEKEEEKENKENEEENEEEMGPPEGCADVLSAVLAWGDESLRPRLLALGAAAPWAHELIRAHDMTNPARLFDALCAALAASELDAARECLAAAAAVGRVFRRDEVAALRAATWRALEETIALVAVSAAAGGEGTKRTHEDAENNEKDAEEEEEEDETDKTDEEGAEEEEGEEEEEEEKEDGDEANEGTEVLYRLSGLADILRSGAPLANALTLSPSHTSGEAAAVAVEEEEAVDQSPDAAYYYSDMNGDVGEFVDSLVPLLLRAVAAVAPPLHPEHFVSIRAMRVVLEDAADPLLLAVERKRHWLGANHFALLVQHVARLLDSHNVSAEHRDSVSRVLLDEMVSDPSCGLAACGQLTRLVPFASDALLRDFAMTKALWDEYEMCPPQLDTDTGDDANNNKNTKNNNNNNNNRATATTAVAVGNDTTGAMLRRERSLETMRRLTLLRCVRTAQFVRLLDACGAVDACGAADVTYLLLRASRSRAALAGPIVSLLDTRLLPRALSRFIEDNSNSVSTGSAAALSQRLSGGLDATWALALRGRFTRDTADGDTMRSARAVASAVTERAASALLDPRGISPAAVASYRAFFAFLDEAADAARDSILSSLPAACDAAVREAVCALPDFAPPAALLCVVVHRHMASRPVVAVGTAKLWIRHACALRPIDGLELLAEIASTRVLDVSVYGEIVHMTLQRLSECYRLRHMPPNGRLVARAAKDEAPSMTHMCRVAVAAIAARRGVVLHNRLDDALRSSVNLVIFDIVVECVVSLRQARPEEVPCIAQLLSFVSGFLSDLVPADVAVLRASESSVATVASAHAYVYQWLCATSIARLEAIGMDIVSGAVRAVALLANLTLMRSSFDTKSTMRLITSKRSLKPMRTEFSSASPAKRKLFTRQHLVISKTSKQKMALFPHLLAWCVVLTSAAPETPTKEHREGVMQLLDILCALLLTPVVPGDRRVEDTYLCLKKSAEEHLGFEVVALTRISGSGCSRSEEGKSMEQLARGAAAVLALLLQGNSFLVKSWLDTVEGGLQKFFFMFIEDHVSPLLIEENLLAVISNGPTGEPTFAMSDSYTVSVSIPQSLLTLRYTMEDASASVQITFPGAFPLRPPTVSYDKGQKCGVSNDKWRSWMHKMTAHFALGDANVWNCVKSFGQCLDTHFTGQEPCPICFAIVSASGRKLPNMRCAVCENSLLHAECLYKWWANTGQTACPLCRSPWVST